MYNWIEKTPATDCAGLLACFLRGEGKPLRLTDRDSRDILFAVVSSKGFSDHLDAT